MDIAANAASFYKGWDVYNEAIKKAITPLTAEQLGLRAAPHLRSIAEDVRHIIAVRIRWFTRVLGEDAGDISSLGAWDHPDQPMRSAQELAHGLEQTYRYMQQCLARWTPADLEVVFKGTHPYYGDYALSRQWVIWHVLEHDLHHGGEVSLMLGMHGLDAPDI